MILSQILIKIKTTDMKLKVSFDWDLTLEKNDIMEFAMALKVMNEDCELWIVTSRRKFGDNLAVFNAANKLSIPNERIVFTEHLFKSGSLKQHSIDIHFDDSYLEIKDIVKSNIPVCVINVNSPIGLQKQFRDASNKINFIRLNMLVFDNGYVIERKENMSPWKVCKIHAFVSRDFLWLLFRYNKLCGAKYIYFSENIDKYKFVSSGYMNSKWVSDSIMPFANEFVNKITGKSISIQSMKWISNIEEFNEVIKWLEG